MKKIKEQIELLIPVIDINIEIHEEDLKNYEGSAIIISKVKIISSLKGQREAYINVLNWIGDKQ